MNAKNLPLTVEIPKPRDPRGNMRDFSMMELRQKIQEYIDLITRNGQAGGHTFGPDVIDNALLNYDDPDVVKVTLAVHVPPLLREMRTPSVRGSRNFDLFRDRDDQMFLGAAQDCMDTVNQASRDIQSLSQVLQSPDAEGAQMLMMLAANHSRAIHEFAVKGGQINMNIDGRPLCIEAPRAKAAIEYEDVTLLQFRLKQNHRYASPYEGEILAVAKGPVGVSRPGRKLTLGFLKERQAVRALLELARQLRVDIWVQVRMAVSTTTMKALTTEVLSVENVDEIFAALQSYRSSQAIRGQAGAANAKELGTDV